MNKHILSLLFCVLGNMHAEPPREIDPSLYNAYTLDNQIPVLHRYLDDSYSSDTPRFWSKSSVDKNIAAVREGKSFYYGTTDQFLYKMLSRRSIQGKRVLIVGSQNPIYEAVVLAFGGYPVTVEYNNIETDDPRLEIYTVEQFRNNTEKFDAILSISSIEHDGLGRYGDPINPNGDLEFMHKAKSYLKDDGMFFLAVPVGKDCLVWNVHRIYGARRLPLLLKEWNLIDSEGFSTKDFRRKLGMCAHQPTLCLTKNETGVSTLPF
ncbi:MAG: DUF268 domain-containing protein [Chlamydiia bacterium]